MSDFTESPRLEPPLVRSTRIEGLFAAATVYLALAFLTIGTWASYFAPLRNDQYQLIQLGRCVYDGGRMYVDCWENKPPGIAWLGALALMLSRGGHLGPWLLPGVTAAAALSLVWLAASRVFSIRTGRRTVLIAALAFSLRIYDAPSINPDFYSGVLELAASAAWMLSLAAEAYPPRTRRDLAWAVLAGFLWAAATMVKQVGCLGLFTIVITVAVLSVAGHADRSRWTRMAATAFLGFALGIGSVAGALAHQGTLREAWFAIVCFNSDLTHWPSLWAAIGGTGRLRVDLAPLAPILWLAALGLGITLYAGCARRLSRSLAGALVLWWVTAAVFALMGPSGSMRYWQATFPPMVWLAGAGLFHIQQAQERLNRPQRTTFIVVTVTTLVLLMRPLLYEIRVGLAASYTEQLQSPNERDNLIDMGQRIAELVPPGERIYVLGYRAGVYVHSNRLAASRFTYPRSAEQMDEILRDLEAGRASLLLIPKRRAPEFEQFCDEACHQRLTALRARHQSLAPIGNYDVFLRQASESSGSSGNGPARPTD